MKISVSLACNIAEPLTYRAEAGSGALRPGCRVLVPLGRRLASGWVMDLDSPYRGRLKAIIGAIDDPFLPDEAMLEFARQAGAAYFTSAGALLEHCLPPSQKGLKSLRLEVEGRQRKLDEFSVAELERLAAAGPLRFSFKAGSGEAAPASPAADTAFAARLRLGPGPEREYREACERTLERGRSVILLVPDNATARYWQSVLPGVDPYHSGVKPAAREKTWHLYRQGKHGIVCGGLSALTLPLARPGLLIIDRASSPLYPRGASGPFRTDHLGEIRAQTADIPLLRGALSHNCASYERPQEPVLDERPERNIPCQVHALKGREAGIPAGIVELIRAKHLAKEKILVLVNRIKPSTLLFCESCRRIAACPRCGSALPIDASGQASCRRCSFRKQALSGCPRCGQALAPLHDISIESLAAAVERVSGEDEVLALTASELSDPERAVAAVQARPIVIATLAALNPFFAGRFACAVWVKPESFFGMEEFNAAEMIHACGAEIAAALAPGGEIHVFSVFHFHHALRTLMDDAAFFEREMKYRRWFMLPPYASVYELELRDGSLRSLAATMRGLNGRYGKDLQVRRLYLASRQPRRGAFRGILELHTSAEKIAEAGLHRLKKSTLRRMAG